jgi:uncharacterized protein
MPNRLAQAQSLYLRKHADNPIDWWPWCDQALEKAQQENKPIFLSIGYSSCHWCTVMEGEAFSDQTIAEYMNANFIPIKVDREERPDLDSIYMQALQLLTGQGGWPLNVFLTPGDRVPFYGGTYFPIDPRYGRPGFLQVLQALRRFYDTETVKLESIQTEILGRLQAGTLLDAEGELTGELLRLGLEYSAGIIGTTGMSTNCFPMIPHAAAALRGARFQQSSRYDAVAISQQRGMNLALGGIFDQVGGGFHRYTVDPTWSVPHFEKMLYDNGLIVEYLADLWTTGFQEPALERAIAFTVAWLKREMTAPSGFFYAAQDADSFVTAADVEPEEGAFYVWQYAELAQILSPDELTELSAQFTVTPAGNFEGKNVLQRQHAEPLSQTAEIALAKLFRVRYGQLPEQVTLFPPARSNQDVKTISWPGRLPAVTDTKMIVAWNSLMISGLAKAAIAWQNSDYLALATPAVQFILDRQWVDGRLHRLNYENQPSVTGQSEDYALLIKALLDVQQAEQVLNSASSQAQSYLEQAIQIQAEFDEFLWSIEFGGYYNTDARADLMIRERSYEDHAAPSANAVTIMNLIRLLLLTEEPQYFDRAEQALRSFSGIMSQSPAACPSLFAALDWFRNLTLLRTHPDGLPDLNSHYAPTAVYRIEPMPAGVIGMVCQGLSCQEPAHSLDQLRQQFQSSLVRN